jgi:LPXTG-site transpeptidase (sortase) family protein
MLAKLHKKVIVVLILLLVGLGLTTLGYSYSAEVFGSQVILPINATTLNASEVAQAGDTANPILNSQTSDFRLSIPSIGLNREVQEDVHPGDESVYGPVIEQRIAHGLYTRKPDEAIYDGNVYMFAHRTGTAHGKNVGFFHDLHLLKQGDKAQVRYAGKTYTYEFVRSFVITPQDTWVYTARSDYPKLTLQTCEQGESLRLMVEFRLTNVS